MVTKMDSYTGTGSAGLPSVDTNSFTSHCI